MRSDAAPPGATASAASGHGRHTNRLATETSPYLLQHAHNPVDWYPWSDEALARAAAERKPIFLSIGYAACHWCHVMERESFEDEATAAQLNRDFVAIKVDREERPDIDQLYMGAVVAMTGQGGWPMSVFLTPEGKPFYGGTYFPDEPRHGMPSFRQVLEGVRHAWDEDPERVESAGTRMVEALVAQQGLPPGDALPGRATMDAAVAALENQFDPVHGGWSGAPKFPQPMTIEFLLRRWQTGDARAIAMARRTLDRMAAGGVHDQLGGGFHRYATDAIWLVPHFEQMLYDNAQLARVYLHAWQSTADAAYLEVATGALDYMLRELATDDGAFAASQDADTEGVEGATFTWSVGDIAEALEGAGLGDDLPLFSTAYGLRAEGNWEGRTILARTGPSDELAERYGLSRDQVEARLARDRAALLERRAARPQPGRDDKALAAWNGLAMAAFADAARALEAMGRGGHDHPRATAYRAAAERAAGVMAERLIDADGRLLRSWKDGRATAPAVLEDHADLAEGFLALYAATFDERWFKLAQQLADTMLEHFADPTGGFFDVADDHPALVTRPKDLQDNAVPSGGSMATTVLLELGALTGEGRYRVAAESALRQVAPYLARYPGGFAQWLVAADLAIGPVAEVAIIGDPRDEEAQALVRRATGGYRPRQVIACAPDGSRSEVPLLHGRFRINDRPTAFVCRDFACRQPVNEPEALAALLIGATDGD
jgi:uncharacterized protein YyaL (SSP411 family)